MSAERLVSVAIVRGGEILSRGFKSHGQLRGALGDADPYAAAHRPADTEGFLTDTGRFVSRNEAVDIGLASGQLGKMWRGAGRKLLSSDVDW